jgi:hypothetical protein
MSRILATKNEGVTLGAMGADFQLVADLVEVTFLDILGAVHTVHAHKNGPFQGAENIVKAWEDGILHPHESTPQAVAPAAAATPGTGY